MTWFPTHSKLKYASSHAECFQTKYFRKKSFAALKSAYPKLPNVYKAVAPG